MAVPRLRVPNAPPAGGPLARSAQQVSDEVELYHRTYTTLLRSSGETLLRVLEPSHRSMSSSLHALAGSEELDLDDLIPTLVPYQIEWNKLRLRLRGADWPRGGEAPEPAECAAVLGGVEDDWVQLSEAWGEAYANRLE